MTQSNQTEPTLLLTAKQAAEALAISPRKLWAITFEEQSGLPYIRCGRLVRYSPRDLEAWIEAHKKGGAAE